MRWSSSSSSRVLPSSLRRVRLALRLEVRAGHPEARPTIPRTCGKGEGAAPPRTPANLFVRSYATSSLAPFFPYTRDIFLNKSVSQFLVDRLYRFEFAHEQIPLFMFMNNQMFMHNIYTYMVLKNTYKSLYNKTIYIY